MDSSNESISQVVLKEMLKYKPSLQKVMTSGEECEEDNDPRYKGQMVIKNLPLPVGVELRRLFSVSLKQNYSQRLEQILATIEKSLQLVSYILISQLWNEKKLNRIVIPENFSKIFRQKIYLRNIENYRWIIGSVNSLLEERSIELFVPELQKSLNEEFTNSYEFYVPGKNPEGRYIITGQPEHVERVCNETEERLIQLLQRLAFLANYKLASVQQIRVFKPKYQQPKYNHVLKLLTCTDSDFNSFEQQDNKCADSHSVLLMKSQLPLNENLNLSPLIIDTASFLTDGQTDNKIKKDIFLYDGSHDNHLNYKGCRVTEKCDLSGLPDYPMLSAQFQDMMMTIGGK